MMRGDDDAFFFVRLQLCLHVEVSGDLPPDAVAKERAAFVSRCTDRLARAAAALGRNKAGGGEMDCSDEAQVGWGGVGHASLFVETFSLACLGMVEVVCVGWETCCLFGRGGGGENTLLWLSKPFPSRFRG